MMVGLDCAGTVSQCELGTLAPVSSAAVTEPWGNDFTKAMKLLWMPVMFGLELMCPGDTVILS